MKRRHKHGAFLMTAAVKQWRDRLSPIFFIIIAGFLFLATALNERLETKIRVSVADITAPILSAISLPIKNTIASFTQASEIMTVYQDNQALKAENERLRKWYQKALSLQLENDSLTKMVNAVKEPKRSFVTTRVITDPTGPFYRSVLIPAGTEHGVHSNHAAIAAEGLVGRVTDVGENAARVLMATDINSRIPIFVGDQKIRAILAGTNDARPELDHLPKDAKIEVGQRLVTSGQGGIFAPGLPVGVIEEITNHQVFIRLFADLDHLDHIQVVDFGLQQIAQ